MAGKPAVDVQDRPAAAAPLGRPDECRSAPAARRIRPQLRHGKDAAALAQVLLRNSGRRSPGCLRPRSFSRSGSANMSKPPWSPACSSSTRRSASSRKAGPARRWRRSRSGLRRPRWSAATANGSGFRRRNWCPATRSGCRSARWFRPMRRIVSGSVMVDQSMLTGESVPVDADPGGQVYAGSLVRRGQAIAEVTATGVEDLFRAHGRAGARRPRRQHRAGRHLCGDAQPRHRQRHGRGSHHRLCLCHRPCRPAT